VKPNLVVELTEHAKVQIIERNLELKWIAEAILNPIYSESDQDDPELTCTYGKITDSTKQKDRVLKVVYNKNTTPWGVAEIEYDSSSAIANRKWQLLVNSHAMS